MTVTVHILVILTDPGLGAQTKYAEEQVPDPSPVSQKSCNETEDLT